MKTALFDYELPPKYIAQQPAEPRDTSKLLVLNRATGTIEHRTFRDIGDYLDPGDLLVANDSRVIPARLFGTKSTGGQVELFLLHRLDDDDSTWEALVRGRGLTAGSDIHLADGMIANITEVLPDGSRHVRFNHPVSEWLVTRGEIPLPPYITEYLGDRERYQTIYSRREGSIAAPTAGLHFTPDLLIDLRRSGIDFATLTLHVGLDTFQPISSEDVDQHPIHTEFARLESDVARRINDTTLAGGKIVAIGTTTVRTLEWAATGAQQIDPYDTQACPWQRTAAFSGPVDLFIRPGYRFRAVDRLITNFHLPRSTLLLLVSAFIAQAYPDDPDQGRQLLLTIYEEAKRHSYRFYSFGDAMLIL